MRPTARQTKAKILGYYEMRRRRTQWHVTLIVSSAAPWAVRHNLTAVVVCGIVGSIAVIVTATRFSRAEEAYKNVR